LGFLATLKTLSFIISAPSFFVNILPELDTDALLQLPIIHSSMRRELHACLNTELLWTHSLICFSNTRHVTARSCLVVAHLLLRVFEDSRNVIVSSHTFCDLVTELLLL
jgi:hypothetical protein